MYSHPLVAALVIEYVTSSRSLPRLQSQFLVQFHCFECLNRSWIPDDTNWIGNVLFTSLTWWETILTPHVLQPSHNKHPAGFFHSLQKGQGFPAPRGCQGLSLHPGDTGLATWAVQSSRNRFVCCLLPHRCFLCSSALDFNPAPWQYLLFVVLIVQKKLALESTRT